MFAHEPQPPRGEWRLRAEHQWEFDLSGYIHLPGMLSPEDTDRCREACASEPPGPVAWELAEEPALRAKIKQLFGEEQVLQASAADTAPVVYGLDRPPQLLSRSDAPLADCLDPSERLRLRYDDMRSRPDLCSALGLRVLWALDPTDEVAIVPCSHKTDPTLPAPESLEAIEALRGTLIRPALAAGDVLLLAAPTVVAMQRTAASPEQTPRVLETLLCDINLCAPGMGYEPRPLEETPEWFRELSPAQQAVLGPREGRPGSAVATDGQTVWADASEGEFAWSQSAAAAAVPRPLMDPGEVWQWETQGYLIVNVMDEDWLAGANLAIDTFRNDPNFVRRIPTSELWQEPDCSSSLLPERPDPDDGGPLLEERMTGLEALPAPHRDHFRRMVAHPAVVERLNWMMGPGWAESPASASVNRPGAGGQQIHGAPEYGRTSANAYHAAAMSHLQATQVNYHWVLRDVEPGDGGFCLIPGSLKMRYSIPRPPITSIDLPAVHHLLPRAGDIVFYSGAHGVLGWRGRHERRQVLKSSHNAQHPLDNRVPHVVPRWPGMADRQFEVDPKSAQATPLSKGVKPRL